MSSPKADVPLRLGDPGDFARVHEFLRQAGYDERSVCRAAGIDHIRYLGSVRWDTLDPAGWGAGLEWCIRVFWRGSNTQRAECASICGAEVLASLQALGLLKSVQADPTSFVCPVWLYPVDGVWMTSDRPDASGPEPDEPAADVVFPALYAGTLRFLELLPDAGGGDALDLCGGSGIGALHLSRSARSAVTADVTARSARFAEFNARLNERSVESVCGDLYGPVDGRQFDLIAAHPPFVPAAGERMIYRDAGEAGEEITRRVIHGLPDQLRPGGTCMILCVARDTENARFEVRARGWLGAAADEFDIVYGLEKVLLPEEVVTSMRKRGHTMSEAQVQGLMAQIRSLQTKQFVYGALFLRRSNKLGACVPLRLHLTPDGTAADFERLLAWRERTRQADFPDWLTGSRPRLASGLELTARHLVNEGALVPAEFVFSVEGGFRSALRPDAWVVPLIAQLEGKRSVREVFQTASDADELPPGFELTDFCGLVERMITLGLLETEAADSGRLTG